MKTLTIKATTDATKPDKAQILNGIRMAVEEVKLVKQGKKKSVPLNDFLNKLKG